MSQRSADIAVVGGGVIGLSCAWRLALGGAKVVVYERDTCGSGASGASLGALIPAVATRHAPAQTHQRESLWMYPAFADELREISGIDIGYRRCQRVELFDDQLRRQSAALEVAASAEWPLLGDGPVQSLLSHVEIRELDDRLHPGEHGGMLCRASARVDAARLIAALERACEIAGVRIERGMEVTGIEIHGDRFRGLRIAERVLESGAGLLCAGAWTTQLCSRVPVSPAKGQAMLLAAPELELNRLVKRGSTYLVPAGDGQVLLGATTEPKAGFDIRPTSASAGQLTQGALRICPSLADARVVRSWAGLRPKPASGRPCMGPVEGALGLHVATGHYKTGICWTPLAGCVMAELVLQGKTQRDWSAFVAKV